MTTVDELRADSRAQDAERRLKAAGFSDAWWEGFLERVANLPTLYEMVSRETAQEASKRRVGLAKKMRELSHEMDVDPSLDGNWLRSAATEVEALSSRKRMLPSLDLRRGNSLKSFVVRGVFHWIEEYLAIGYRLGIVTSDRSRNLETALLASAILQADVTANDVTKIRKQERRKYFKE